MSKRMTVGFIFTSDGSQVLLIQKKRPEWQKGRYNGIGGHLNTKEEQYFNFEGCFVREVKEECNLTIKPNLVKQIGRIICLREDVIVPIYVYKMGSEEEIMNVQQLTDEPLKWWNPFELKIQSVVPNLMFLVPFAWYCLNQPLLKKGNIILEYD